MNRAVHHLRKKFSSPLVTTPVGDRLAAILAIICIFTLPFSILEAEWMPASGTLFTTCALSLTCGMLAARARLPRFLHWPLSILLGLALATFTAGLFKINTPALLVRVAAWGTDLLAGRVIQDPALVTLEVTLWVWWASYSAAHGIARGGWALHSFLPLTLSLAIHSIYARQGPTYIILFLFGLITLMAWTAQNRRQASWAARGVDYPTELWPEWMGSGLSVAWATCLVALMLSMLTSRTTVEWMRHTVDRPVTRVQQVVQQLLGGAYLRSGAGEQADASHSATMPTSRLINAPPQLGEQAVMWVWTDEIPPLPDDVSLPPVGKAGWRGMTYSIYTGRGWSNPTLASRPLPESDTISDSRLVRQRFEIVASHGDTLFALNQPISGEAGAIALYRSEDDLAGLRGTLSQYTVVSRIAADPGVVDQSLSPPPFISELYLQLPDTLPQRVRDLAGKITAEATQPYDKALKIETFLRTYLYTLDLPPLPAGRDLVDYFLYDAPGGYCDYYASAMVVMLRSVGVPARLASGYARGAYDFDRGAYRVLADDAHSWPEVYLAGAGWVEFEPTAGRPLLERARRLPNNPVISAGQVRAAQQWGRLAQGTACAVLIISAAAAYVVRRERQLAALPPSELVPLLYQRLRRRGRWLGVKTCQSDTPDEFMAAFSQAIEQRIVLQQQTHVRQAAARLAQLYCTASYSASTPGATEARQALEAWRALRWRTWLRKRRNLLSGLL